MNKDNYQESRRHSEIELTRTHAYNILSIKSACLHSKYICVNSDNC